MDESPSPFIGLVKQGARVIWSSPMLLLSAWTALIGAWGLSLAVAVLAAAPWVPGARRGLLVASLSVAAGVLAGPSALRAYSSWHEGAAERALSRTGADLPLRDCAVIYGLNVVMGVGGFALGLPEVGAETLLLFLPGDGERRWDSDFAMASPRVRDEVARLGEELAASTRTEARSSVAWRTYWAPDDSPRVSLALNGPLRLEARKTSDGLAVTGRVDVRYPERSRFRIGRVAGVDLEIEEGLFYDLQERGWLHPYEARFTWTVTEESLADPPRRGWRERALLGLLGR